jgi:hypothetical protein
MVEIFRYRNIALRKLSSEVVDVGTGGKSGEPHVNEKALSFGVESTLAAADMSIAMFVT